MFAALLGPEKIQTAVTLGDVIGLLEAEAARGAIDPSRGAFQLQKNADRRFVEHDDATAGGLVKFGAVFLVAEDRKEAEQREDAGQRLGIGRLHLDFLAAFVHSGFGGALVSERRFPAREADTQQAARTAKREVARVENGVGFEDALAEETKAGLAEQVAGASGARNAQLDFGFAGTG